MSEAASPSDDGTVPPVASPVARLRGAVCVLGGFPALAGVDLDLHAGEVAWLRGPNGAGKTTLLRLLAGLGTVRQGSAEVLGADLTRVADRRWLRRRVGLLAHATFLYDDLTVEENIRFWADLHRSDPGDVDSAMARFGLDGRLRTVPVRGLSAGQRRRTSLAVLVARRPLLWLLDEPHAGLDAEGRAMVDRLITDATGAGATVIVASHDADHMPALAPRVLDVAGGVVRDAPAPGAES